MTSKQRSGPCIYTTPAGLCSGAFPLHPKEHYLPAGLGNFKNDIRLKDFICTNCQKIFGALEDVFLHNSPEAFFRFVTGKKGRKTHRKKDIFYEPTAGIAPLTVKGLQVDPDKAAEYLSLSRKHVLKLARLGILPAHPLGHGQRKTWRFLLSELREWMLSNGSSPKTSNSRTIGDGGSRKGGQ